MFHFRKTVYVLDVVMSKCGHEQHLKINNHNGWNIFFFFLVKHTKRKKTYITILA